MNIPYKCYNLNTLHLILEVCYMSKKILFPQIKGLLHGSDYNPDQWLDRPDILEKDIELMKKAKMTSMSVGIFAWAAYEPSEGEFHRRITQ